MIVGLIEAQDRGASQVCDAAQHLLDAVVEVVAKRADLRLELQRCEETLSVDDEDIPIFGGAVVARQSQRTSGEDGAVRGAHNVSPQRAQPGRSPSRFLPWTTRGARAFLGSAGRCAAGPEGADCRCQQRVEVVWEERERHGLALWCGQRRRSVGAGGIVHWSGRGRLRRPHPARLDLWSMKLIMLFFKIMISIGI